MKLQGKPKQVKQGEQIQDFRRRGHQPSSWGHQHIIFTKFSEKLHKIENILVRAGEGGRQSIIDNKSYQIIYNQLHFSVVLHR